MGRPLSSCIVLLRKKPARVNDIVALPVRRTRVDSKRESRVAILRGPRKFEIVDRARPAPREGEALVKIAATAVCHTDLDMYTGANKAVRYPVVLGHESTGTIEALGSEGSGLEVGQTVLINPVITCGHCDSCE